MSPIERALAEIERIGNERNLIIVPAPVPAPAPVALKSTLSGEQNEAMQGAITVLRSQAEHYNSGPYAGTMGNMVRRWRQWADVLEEMWEGLR
jgi:hypothetical protein